MFFKKFSIFICFSLSFNVFVVFLRIDLFGFFLDKVNMVFNVVSFRSLKRLRVIFCMSLLWFFFSFFLVFLFCCLEVDIKG